MTLTLKTTKKAPKATFKFKNLLLNTAVDYNEEFILPTWIDCTDVFDFREGLYILDPADSKEKKLAEVEYENIEDTNVYKIGKNQYYIVFFGDNLVVRLASPSTAVTSDDVFNFRIKIHFN